MCRGVARRALRATDRSQRHLRLLREGTSETHRDGSSRGPGACLRRPAPALIPMAHSATPGNAYSSRFVAATEYGTNPHARNTVAHKSHVTLRTVTDIRCIVASFRR